ncbi:threonine/serine exporter family protein [Agromyces sp. H66]|uniref:threonine/serine ThrE exporter family protein n=1 Tax=Agromyces sp. H66 TaxID=2529859 RepID=UPI0010AB0805|nr:threonine/serine exporter family protein [Agromyces sp. H66]
MLDQGDWLSWTIAAGVLTVCAVLLLALRPRAERDLTASAKAAAHTGAVPVSAEGGPDSAATLAATEAVGDAMIRAGYSVMTVRSALEDIARVNHLPASQVVVFPTALLVSARGEGEHVGEHRTGAVTSGEGRLLLAQVDELQRTVDAARLGVLDPASTIDRIRRIRRMPPTYGRVVRVIGYTLLSGALAVMLGTTWTGVMVAVGLGALVGAALLVSERVPSRYGALITVGMALAVSLVVFLLLDAGFGPRILAALIAPLVVLLPGTLLTTAVLELSTGQMISGAGRLAAGGMQLVLLAAGILTAGALVGVPDFDFAEHPEALGPFAPWIAVAVFGVGIAVHQCAPPRSIPWILLVLYVAYGAQVIGDVFLGGVLSAFVGAVVVIPVTALVARQPSGPAALVSFVPAFWLLVPGALGLLGVADVLGGDTGGTNSLVATISTMVAIALGVLAGSVVSNRMQRPAL